MPKSNATKPTASELAILQVLWQRGPSTVRELMEALAEERAMGYTTVLKFVQIMHEKGLVKRDDSGKTHVFSAALPAEKMQRRLVGDFLDKVFAGSVGQLVLHALGSKKTSPEEMRAIRTLLDELDPPKGKRE